METIYDQHVEDLRHTIAALEHVHNNVPMMKQETCTVTDTLSGLRRELARYTALARSAGPQ